MKLPQDIILRPLLTERSYQQMQDGRYTFVVDKNANKLEIKQAVESLFEVKVLAVNTMNMEGKMKRVGQHRGRRPSWKKAIVKIDTNPVVETYLAKGGKVTNTNKKYKTSIEAFGIVE